MAEGAGATILNSALEVTDPDPGDVLTYTVTAGPSAGSLNLGASFTQAQIDAGSLSYTQNGSEVTSDSFSFTVSDGQGGSIGSTVFALTITPVNDAPIAVADIFSGDEDSSLTMAASGVLANDADIEGDLLTAVLVSNTAVGTVALAADGSFTWSGAPLHWFGTTEFTYTADDGAAQSGITSVTLNIANVNDAPSLGLTALPDAIVGVPYSAMITPTDPDPGDVLALSLIAGPLWIQSPVDNGNGTWTLSGLPLAGDQGLRVVTLRVTDSGSPSMDEELELPLTVILSVAAVPTLSFWLICVLVTLLAVLGARYVILSELRS